MNTELLARQFPDLWKPGVVIGHAAFSSKRGIDVGALWKSYGGKSPRASTSLEEEESDAVRRSRDAPEKRWQAALHEARHVLLILDVPGAVIHRMTYRPSNSRTTVAEVSFTLPDGVDDWTKARIAAAGDDGDRQQLFENEGIVCSDDEWNSLKLAASSRCFYDTSLASLASMFFERDLSGVEVMQVLTGEYVNPSWN